jgi:hypothetical protein
MFAVEPAVRPPLLIRQKPDRHRCFLLRKSCKSFKFCAIGGNSHLLRILICTSLLQKLILLQDFCYGREQGYERRLCEGVDPGPKP